MTRVYFHVINNNIKKKNIHIFVFTRISAYLYSQRWALERRVSRDFGGLQIILMDEACVPDVPLEVYLF